MTTGSKPEELDDDDLTAAAGGIDPNRVAMQIKPQMVDTSGPDATGLRDNGVLTGERAMTTITGLRANDTPTGVRVTLKK